VPPVGSPLVSEFALPGITLALELRGRLVWSNARSGRAGVRFEAMDPGLAELLSNFVAGRLCRRRGRRRAAGFFSTRAAGPPAR